MADFFSSQSGKIIFKAPNTDPVTLFELAVDGKMLVSGDMVVGGDLTVQGSGTAKDQTSLTVEDSLIVANFGELDITSFGTDEAMGYIVDRGMFSIINVVDPNEPTIPNPEYDPGLPEDSETKPSTLPNYITIIQRLDEAGNITTDGTGTPVYRDDQAYSYHGQTIPGTPPDVTGLKKSAVSINNSAPRGIVWRESVDTGIWDFSFNFPGRVDGAGTTNVLPSLPVETVSIKGITTPTDVPETINTDYVSSIGYVNVRAQQVQDNVDYLNDYLDTGTVKNIDDIMYYDGAIWKSAELEIFKDKSPTLAAPLDLNAFELFDDVGVTIRNATQTIDLDATGFVVDATSVILNGITYPEANTTQGYVLAASNTTGDLEFQDINTLAVSFNIITDKSPELGGTLDVLGHGIVSSVGDIHITPKNDIIIGENTVIKTNDGNNITIDPDGDLILNANKWPDADGVDGEALLTDGAGNTAWTRINQWGVEEIVAGNGLSQVVTPLGESTRVELDVNPGNGIKIDTDTVAIQLASDSGMISSNQGLTNNFTVSGLGTNGTSTDVARGNHYHENATTILDGYMAKQDKVKIDGIQNNAELNTASNLGTGEGIFASKNVSDLQFKSIKAGANVVLTSDGNEITISSDNAPADLVQSVTAGDGTTNTGGNVIGDVVISVDGTVVRTTRTIASGNGLTGGGNLGSNRTLSVVAGDGIVVGADVSADFATSGGNNGTSTKVAREDHRHANVTTTVDGFMSAVDKVALDDLISGGGTPNQNIIAGSGLTGGGNGDDVTINAIGGAGITVLADSITHADTSSQLSVNNANGVVIQDITLDEFGHISALGSVNLDSRYYTESESNSRFSLTSHTHDDRYYTEAESTARFAPISHNHDALYYTEAEADSRFAATTHTHSGLYYTETESDARFLGVSAKAADSQLLDGLDSTEYLRSNANDIKTAGYLRFNDNVYMSLGSSSNVEHFWNGTNYYTDINGGANWYIRDGNSSNATRFTFDVDTGNLSATTFSGSLSGNASTATSAGRWTTARTTTFTGDVSGSVSLSGSGNTTCTMSIGTISGDVTVNGTLSATGDLKAYQTSDIRSKDVIEHISNASEKLSTLDSIKFTYKKQKEKGVQYGLVAQQVQEILPEIVAEGDEGMLKIQTGGNELVSLLIAAHNEHTKQLNDLVERNNELANEIKTLKESKISRVVNCIKSLFKR